jgi:hypothetical protein
MNQIKSIKLGVIAICIATVPLSSAQTPRTRTSGSNQTTAAPIHTGSNGNSTRAPQIGINPGNAAITGSTPNIGAYTATTPGVRTGISNQAIGMTGAATGKGGSSRNSTGVTQTGINAGTGPNTKANTNAGGHAGAAAATPIIVNTIPQLTPVPTQAPLPNNDPLGPNFSTPGESPSPSASASVSPSPTQPPIG